MKKHLSRLLKRERCSDYSSLEPPNTCKAQYNKDAKAPIAATT
jgi:hypothetical protein